MTGWVLLALTFLLVLIGSGLVVLGAVGWAQLMFVLASGMAGGGIVLVISGRD